MVRLDDDHRVRRRRHPRPHRGRQRGPGPRPPVPPPHRAGPGAVPAGRPRRGSTASAAGRAGAGPARRARPATGPSCSTGPALVVGTKADVVPTAEPPLAELRCADGEPPPRDLGRHRRRACGRSSGAMASRGARGPGGRARARGRRAAPPGADRVGGRARSATASSASSAATVERAVALTDLTHPRGRWPTSATGSTASASTKLLARAGAADGDVVRIGEFSFEYQPDALRRASVVVKIGTSSITDERRGRSTTAAIAKLRRRGGGGCAPPATRSIVVSSGAIAAGLPALGLAAPADRRAARCRRSRPSASPG